MIPFPKEEATPPGDENILCFSHSYNCFNYFYLVVSYELKNRKIIKKRGRMQTFPSTILLKNAILKDSYVF